VIAARELDAELAVAAIGERVLERVGDQLVEQQATADPREALSDE
jgi:hypothetical protein